MVLKEYSAAWPPNITIGDAAQTPTIPPKADLGDRVLDAQYRCIGELLIRLRSKNSEYTAILPVPASLQRNTIVDIIRKRAMTLREIGELPIS